MAKLLSAKLSKSVELLQKQMQALQKQMQGLDQHHRALLHATQELDVRAAKGAADQAGQRVSEIEGTLRTYAAAAKAHPGLIADQKKAGEKKPVGPVRL